MHVSVLYDEVLAWLAPQPGGRYIDGTLGWGGHTHGILEASAPDGHVLAFDRDAEALAAAQVRLGAAWARVTAVNASYAAMGQLAPQHGFGAVDGVLLDLGLSSLQLDSATRGFAFRHDAPLDMRFDQRQPLTAAAIVNNYSEEALADVLWRYGEEPRSRQFARAIVARRPLARTGELAELLAALVPARERRQSHLHPATRTFQALRIAVNDELAAVETGVPAAIKLLKSGGRLVVISFHSLEDRIVKQTLRDLSRDCICPPRQPVCTCGGQNALIDLPVRKAIKPGAAEIARNPRSRSARLRVAQKR